MSDLVSRRMCRQRLWGRPMASVDEVIRFFGAMQAQEFLAAKWAIAQRSVAGLADIDEAFAAGRLLRLHVLRPTWHFVHAADIGWMLAASAARVHAVNGYYYRRTGVDDDVVARSRTVFEKALGDGEQLSRAELTDRLTEAGLPLRGVPLAYVIMHAELSGILISGAMRGKQHTYALLAARVPHLRTVGREEALAELTRRYFAARGPATIKDYCVWASLTVPDARLGMDALGGELVGEPVGERKYWSIRGTEAVRRPRQAVVDLLQDYDEYVMGYSESRDVMIGAATPAVAVRARLRPMLLAGQLIGFWRHSVAGGVAELTMFLTRTLTDAETAATQAAVDRFGAFLSVPARWSIG